MVEAVLGDTSEFEQNPLLEVVQEGDRFIVRLRRCVSIAHAVATVALELSKTGKPPEIHFGWSDESPLAANLGLGAPGRTVTTFVSFDSTIPATDNVSVTVIGPGVV